MNYRDLIRVLKPMEGTIIRDILANGLTSDDLAPYCGRRIYRVRHLAPAERSHPTETVVVQFYSEPGFVLSSRFIQEVTWSQAHTTCHLHSIYGHIATLFLTAYHPQPAPSTNRPQTNPEPKP